MELKTAFSLGDKVWVLTQQTQWEQRECDLCWGDGHFLNVVGKRTVECHKCLGKGVVKSRVGDVWIVKETPLTIGCVQIDVRESVGTEDGLGDNYKPQHSYRERYMCVETGIGTGKMYGIFDLFEDKESAQSHANALNYELPKEQSND